MSKKHFELITATNRAEFAEKVNKRLQEGWELLGNAGIASEPGVPWYLMQAMVSGSDDQGGTIIDIRQRTGVVLRCGERWSVQLYGIR